MKQLKIKLRLITKNDYRFLYNLLKERDPRVNISHKKMPTYDEHLKFIRSKPYEKWYIIEFGASKVGSVYLTHQNEIGIFMKKSYQKKGFGNTVLSELIKKAPKKRYLANISPKNTNSEKFFKSNGFRYIQKTYEFEL